MFDPFALQELFWDVLVNLSIPFMPFNLFGCLLFGLDRSPMCV